MKILAFGLPELILFLIVVILAIIIIVLLVKNIRKGGGTRKAYERLAQLDDLYKRGTINEEEYQQRRQEAIKHL